MPGASGPAVRACLLRVGRGDVPVGLGVGGSVRGPG